MIPKPGNMLRSARAEMRPTVTSFVPAPHAGAAALQPARHRHRREVFARVATLAGFAFLVGGALVSSGCENKAIGRPCDLETVADNSATQNSSALECPSRICVKPSLNPSVASSPSLPIDTQRSV